MTDPLRAVPDYKPTIADQILEHKLAMLLNAQLYELDRDKRRELCAKHAQLHATRSLEMVAHLEKQQGLYRGTNQNN